MTYISASIIIIIINNNVAFDIAILKVTFMIHRELKACYSVRCRLTWEINLYTTSRPGVEPGFIALKANVLPLGHCGKEIPTSIPMFPGSSNTERLVGILSDVKVCRKSKMAADNRRSRYNQSPSIRILRILFFEEYVRILTYSILAYVEY